MYYLLIPFAASLVLTLVSINKYSKKLAEKDIVIIDKYKSHKPKVPTQGAFFVIISALIVLSFYPFIVRVFDRLLIDFVFEDISHNDLSILFVICLFAGYGIIDDFLDLGWNSKIFVPLFFSFPLLTFISPQYLDLPFVGKYEIDDLEFSFLSHFNIYTSDIFKIIIIPIYIMVIANLVNMHSGFNGLQSGLSCILLSILIFRSIYTNNSNILVFVTFAGGMFGLWYYNKFPSRIFEGNVGSMMFGAVIGTFLVVNDYYLFGVFIFLPHILDFLIFVYSRIKEKKFRKFGTISSEGFIISPTKYKLKFFLPYFFKLRENEVVNYLHLITFSFGIIGILIFE